MYLKMYFSDYKNNVVTINILKKAKYKEDNKNDP